MDSSHLLSVFSVIASITALETIVIFVVAILVACKQHKRDTLKAGNANEPTTGGTSKVEEELCDTNKNAPDEKDFNGKLAMK